MMRRLLEICAVLGGLAALFAVFAGLNSASGHLFGISIGENPSQFYRSELARKAPTIIDASYSLLAKPGVTEDLRAIEDISERLAAMQSIFTKYVDENSLEGDLQQVVMIYDSIIKCHRDWKCRIDDYSGLADQMINVWFSYGEKIRQMRGDKTGTDFGVELEREAKRLRTLQKARVG